MIDPSNGSPYEITATGTSGGVPAEIAVQNNTIGVGGDDVLQVQFGDVFNLSFVNTTGQDTDLSTISLVLSQFNDAKEDFIITVVGMDADGVLRTQTFDLADVDQLTNPTSNTTKVVFNVNGFDEIRQSQLRLVTRLSGRSLTLT